MKLVVNSAFVEEISTTNTPFAHNVTMETLTN